MTDPLTDPLTGDGDAVPPPPPIHAPTGGRHPVNIGHLVMGLVFLTFVGAWGLVQTDVVTGDDMHWLLPIPWVVGGAVGVAVAVVAGVRRRGAP